MFLLAPVPRIVGAALVAALTLVPATGPTSAADGEIIWGVQPATADGPDGRTAFEYSSKPGAVINDWAAVTNRGTTPATLRVYGADATADYDSGAFTLVGADVASTDLGNWISVDGNSAECPDSDDAAEAACAMSVGRSITLDPGARAIVPFTITVPDNATPGDHSAGIVAGFVSEASGNGATVRREDRVGTRIYLRIDGQVLPGLAMTGATLSYAPSWVPFAPGDGSLTFDVVNSGNTRVSASPTVRVTGPLGIGLGRIVLDPIENLVPGASTRVTAELPDIPALLLLSAEVTLTAMPASGVAASDPLSPSTSASTTVWAVSWTGLAILVLLAGLIWFVLWRRRRARLAREEREWVEDSNRISAQHAAGDLPAPTVSVSANSAIGRRSSSEEGR